MIHRAAWSQFKTSKCPRDQHWPICEMMANSSVIANNDLLCLQFPQQRHISSLGNLWPVPPWLLSGFPTAAVEIGHQRGWGGWEKPGNKRIHHVHYCLMQCGMVTTYGNPDIGKTIGEFELDLQSRNAQFGSKLVISYPVWLWNLMDDLGKQ